MGTLATSNKHLSTALKRREAIRLTVETSSAIEGIRAPFKAKQVAAGKAARKTPTATKVKRRASK